MLLNAPNSDGPVATHYGLQYGYTKMTCVPSHLLLHIVVFVCVNNEADLNTHHYPKKHAQLTDLYRLESGNVHIEILETPLPQRRYVEEKGSSPNHK